MSGLTADHYFWCSGGVPGCFEGVPGTMGCPRTGASCPARGVPGMCRVLQTPAFCRVKVTW